MRVKVEVEVEYQPHVYGDKMSSIKMCSASMNHGKCKNVGKGTRCPEGYHVKGTKKDNTSEVPTIVQGSVTTVIPQTSQVMTSQTPDSQVSFLEQKLMNQYTTFKEEMRNLFKEGMKEMMSSKEVNNQPQMVDLVTVVKLIANQK